MKKCLHHLNALATPQANRIGESRHINMFHRIHQVQNLRKSGIRGWDRFSRLTGWRKSAHINTFLVSTVFLVLLSCHIILWAKPDSTAGYQIIHSGRCDGNGVGRLNTVLHLIINVLSSLVLASTNFFMQVLNAPSREELDTAHEKGSWLDIGVPSPRNAFKVSRFKMIMWLLFFLSSIPIHLLFNSAIFSTDHRRSTFNFFVFDESVFAGGAVFDPGTRLALPYNSPAIRDSYYHSNYSTARELYFESGNLNRSASIQQTAEEIRKGDWKRLDTNSCSSLYNSTHCAGLRTYRNVALILRGSSGWSLSQVWDLPANESSFWDAYVPKDVNNSFWFASISKDSQTVCQTSSTSTTEEAGTEIYCFNDCNREMGLDDSNSDTWSYSLFLNDTFHRGLFELNSTSSKPEFDKSRLRVEYCLAEPFPTDCQIGLASNLLLVVSVCILVKVVLCVIVIVKLGKDTSLVTPGDVIESFVSHPPDYSLGSCLLDRTFLESFRESNRCQLIHGPIQWTSKTHRRWDAIPTQIWLSSYLIFSIGIVLLIYFFSSCYYLTHWRGSFGQDVGNQTIGFQNQFLPTFEQAILIANSPQLFLSFAYLAFNGLFTRLQMAKEWAAMSTRYKALRVTNPKGQQSSTYFLQLPYRYSVPLLIISILLHWILSGCIYLLVMQGSYFDSYGADGPFDSVMALGFSTKSLFTMMTLSIALAFMPPFFGRLSLPHNTVVVGSNSLAIAASCQVSPLVGQTYEQPHSRIVQQEYMAGNQDSEIELRHFMAPSPSFLTLGDQASESWSDEEERKVTLLRVSQSKIRWGVVKMPSSWSEQFIRRETEVEHISFGLPEDDVQKPVVGHWYA
ncbi:hypothetical protein F5883DRAFT_496436 [Diaporthe sp. PMI_573]|nr:hypothetical protein F5883DRAFT_496436 [Diaporthaceae sp. PMI_573]